MAINLVCVPIIYVFYPETKYRSLEEMEVLFGKEHGRRGSSGTEEVLPEDEESVSPTKNT